MRHETILITGGAGNLNTASPPGQHNTGLQGWLVRSLGELHLVLRGAS